ncbi:hypothetical protein ACWF82_29365 [Nocardia sp. NPDC055053]
MTGPDTPHPSPGQPVPPPQTGFPAPMPSAYGNVPPSYPGQAGWPHPGAPHQTPPPARTRKVWPVAIAACLGGMLLAGGAVAAGAAALWPDPPEPDHAAIALAATTAAREAARVASCDYARVMTTYSAPDLDSYFARSSEGATNPYKQEFDDAAGTLRQAMVSAQVSSRVEDLDCYYKSGDGDEIIITDVMAQFRRNVTQPNEDKQTFVVEMTMKKVGDRWLCSKLTSPMLKK